MRRINVIDSHTGGEPTRVILDGQILLSGDSMAKRRDHFASEFDHIRTGCILEPRGSDILVGAILTPPVNPGSVVGVIFFNDIGYLGMCGHGTIGVVETLKHLGIVGVGKHAIDTPVGTVVAESLPSGEVSIVNVPSRVKQLDVLIEVEGIGQVIGDVAYGGNWFFIVRSPKFEITLANSKALTEICWKIRHKLAEENITGDEGAEIDHVELFAFKPLPNADSMNFVQCPGGAYDRSPCGTGTSAKLATLFARGELIEGQEYRQASVTSSVFTGSVAVTESGVIPTIRGRAHITGVAELMFQDDDPIAWGLVPRA